MTKYEARISKFVFYYGLNLPISIRPVLLFQMTNEIFLYIKVIL